MKSIIEQHEEINRGMKETAEAIAKVAFKNEVPGQQRPLSDFKEPELIYLKPGDLVMGGPTASFQIIQPRGPMLSVQLDRSIWIDWVEVERTAKEPAIELMPALARALIAVRDGTWVAMCNEVPQAQK